MPRIQQLIQPGQRTAGGKVVFPLLGLAAACFALYAQAHVAEPQPAPAAPAHVVVKRVVTGSAPANAPVQPGQTVVTKVMRLRTDEAQDGFALVRKGDNGYSISGSTDDMDAIKAARASIEGDFLWFRRGTQAYVVVDPATVARAQQAWHKVEVLAPKMEGLDAQMDVDGKHLRGPGTRMEKRIVIRHASPEMEAAAGEASAKQMETLSEQVQPHIAMIEAQSQQLEAGAKPTKGLSPNMEEAGKPMKMMKVKKEVLGPQHEQQVKAAEQEMQAVISAAMAQGLAKPAPGDTKSP